jgi:DNA-binding MarR family transcriptional regulator
MVSSNINESLFAFLKAIYAFEQKERELFSLTWQEMLLLKHLRVSNNLTMSEINTLLNIMAFQGTRLADSLIKKGFIQREINPSDARGKSISITQEGLQQLEKIDTYHIAVINTASEKIGKERSEELLSMMLQLDQLLGLS